MMTYIIIIDNIINFTNKKNILSLITKVNNIKLYLNIFDKRHLMCFCMCYGGWVGSANSAIIVANLSDSKTPPSGNP